MAGSGIVARSEYTHPLVPPEFRAATRTEYDTPLDRPVMAVDTAVVEACFSHSPSDVYSTS